MTNETTSKQYLFQLQLIYGAQAMTLLVMGIAAYFITAEGPQNYQMDNGLVYALAAVVIVALTAAHFLFNLLVRKIDMHLDLRSKLQKYQSAVIIRSAVLEFPGLLASVICILTGNLLPLMGVAVILVVFFILRPSVSSIIQDLNLSNREKAILENSSSVIS